MTLTENELRGADDEHIFKVDVKKKKSDHYISRNLPSFLLLGCLWGKLQFLSVWREHIKGARPVNAQKSRHGAYL